MIFLFPFGWICWFPGGYVVYSWNWKWSILTIIYVQIAGENPPGSEGLTVPQQGSSPSGRVQYCTCPIARYVCSKDLICVYLCIYIYMYITGLDFGDCHEGERCPYVSFMKLCSLLIAGSCPQFTSQGLFVWRFSEVNSLSFGFWYT